MDSPVVSEPIKTMFGRNLIDDFGSSARQVLVSQDAGNFCADNDPLAVLDADCRVRGVEKLRVVDSSIFPLITNGNLNAPTIMAAEKAADIIRGRRRLTEQADYWLDEQWQNQQRVAAPARASTH